MDSLCFHAVSTLIGGKSGMGGIVGMFSAGFGITENVTRDFPVVNGF